MHDDDVCILYIQAMQEIRKCLIVFTKCNKIAMILCLQPYSLSIGASCIFHLQRFNLLLFTAESFYVTRLTCIKLSVCTSNAMLHCITVSPI